MLGISLLQASCNSLHTWGDSIMHEQNLCALQLFVFIFQVWGTLWVFGGCGGSDMQEAWVMQKWLVVILARCITVVLNSK